MGKSSNERQCDPVDMIGESAAFLAAHKLISRIARCDANVLIEGETGTGKELAARSIHYQSNRRAGPFIPVNCGAIPEALVESELFGHRQGAFTDAKKESLGILFLADGGTLFLDEVDSLTLRAQVALLRFLQERTIRRVGEGFERSIDVRVVAASSRNLEKLSAMEVFRSDLFYRLNVMYVRVPPLKERGGDIELLASHFLEGFSRRHGLPRIDLDRESAGWLRAQSWPGNIRQLENFLEREFLMAEGGPLRVSTLAPQTGTPPSDVRWNYRRAKARVLECFDRQYLDELMSFVGGNVSLAARTAGKERRDLGRLLRKYQIRPQEFRGELHR
ncbi:MAG TPA: sigma-54 dependent transcriptional regulator [Rhizomicrobium sp.]